MKYKIVIVGMMGSGKSSTTKELSKLLNIPSYEADEIFENQQNCSIKDFFKTKGEEEFRKIESQILIDILKKDSFILSTGGGVVLSEKNRELLFSKDIFSIYLSARPQTIFDRIKDDKTRPLLLVDEPQKEIEKIINNRKRYYQKAALTVITDNKTPKEIAGEIANYAKN